MIAANLGSLRPIPSSCEYFKADAVFILQIMATGKLTIASVEIYYYLIRGFIIQTRRLNPQVNIIGKLS